MMSGISDMSISRREALLLCAGTGLSATMASLVPTSAIAQPARPVRGGILKLRYPGAARDFDPFSNTATRALAAISPCYNSLVKFDPLNLANVVGDLALSWTVDDAQLVYTFKIVENAKFHDGVPLTSADVKTTFDYLIKPPSGFISVRKELFSTVESIEAPDAYTVVFKLRQPTLSFLRTLASGWMVIAPKHILTKVGNLKNVLIGSGPFKLKSNTPGVLIQLERNPNYHKKDLPYLDGVQLHAIPNDATTYNYFLTRQLDIYDPLPLEYEATVEKDTHKDASLVSAMSYQFDVIAINTTRGPLKDIRVREAISLAIDRREAVSVLRPGNSFVSGAFPSGNWSLSAEELQKISGYGADQKKNQEQAKDLLDKAGYKQRLKISLCLPNVTIAVSVATFIQAQLAKAGIDLDLQINEIAQYTDRRIMGDYDLLFQFYNLTDDNPDTVLGDYLCNAGMNLGKLCDAGVERLIQTQSTIIDEKKRITAVNETERAILKQFSMIYLYQKKRAAAHWNYVQNFKVSPTPDRGGELESIWIAKS